MSKRLIEYDPLTRTTTHSDYNEVTDTLTIHTEQDVTAILEHNDRYRNDPEYSKRGIKNEMWHYACVPNIIIERWMIEHGVNLFDRNHEAAVWMLINSPEYRRFKLTEKIHF